MVGNGPAPWGRSSCAVNGPLLASAEVMVTSSGSQARAGLADMAIAISARAASRRQCSRMTIVSGIDLGATAAGIVGGIKGNLGHT